jgi:hypothetical protein
LPQSGEQRDAEASPKDQRRCMHGRRLRSEP